MMHSLSEREIEILNLLVLGFTNKAIALELNVSTKTIENHLRYIYARLDVSRRTEAVAICLTQGIIQYNPII